MGRVRTKLCHSVVATITLFIALELSLLLACHAQSSRCYRSPNVFQDSRSCCGLTDIRGKELVPPIYSDVRYFGHGLFVMDLPDLGKKDGLLVEKQLVNRKGVRLKFHLPKEATFSKLLWLGRRADINQEFVPDELPDDSLIVFRIENSFGVCDKDGKVFLPASFSYIGTARENKVVVRDMQGQLLVVDLENKQQKKVQYDDDYSGAGTAFADGLALIHGKAGYGFIDVDGKVAIEPKFNFAYSFDTGRAWVALLAEDKKSTYGVFVDKSGKVVSPSNLKMMESFGGLAVAWNRDIKAGVVNREFEFVVKPEFDVLIAQPAPVFSEEDAWSQHSKPPLFYYASKKNGKEPHVISTSGQALFALPEGIHLPNWPPYVKNGVIVCPVGKESPHSEIIYLNMEGQKVAEPYAQFSKNERIKFREIAPGILLKTVKLATDSLH